MAGGTLTSCCCVAGCANLCVSPIASMALTITSHSLPTPAVNPLGLWILQFTGPQGGLAPPAFGCVWSLLFTFNATQLCIGGNPPTGAGGPGQFQYSMAVGVSVSSPAATTATVIVSTASWPQNYTAPGFSCQRPSSVITGGNLSADRAGFCAGQVINFTGGITGTIQRI